jgi:hypothetical protein
MSIDGLHTPQKLRQSRPASSEQLEELDATYFIALQRCQNAKGVYDTRCKVSHALEVDCIRLSNTVSRSTNVKAVGG